MTTLTIDLCCNDGRNGAFQGWFDAIEVHAETGEHLEMSSYVIDWPGGPTVSFERYTIRVNGVEYPIRERGTGGGNWCWDSVSMHPKHVAALLRQLHKLGFALDDYDEDFPGLENVIREVST